MSGRDGQLVAGVSVWARFANLVKLPHTVFALPFALTGVVLASRESAVKASHLLWVVLAFTCARFAAMGFNRIVDRHIDARNPRTASREIPSGLLTVRTASVAVLVAAVLFIFAAGQLNRLCLVLSPLALAVVLFYSYTKRFTRWSHLVLGAGLGIAPVGGFLAITGSWSDPWWMLPALAGAVLSWVAGFDILYALQDVDFDRAEKLHSVPSRLGEVAALRIAQMLHLVSVLALAAAGLAIQAGLLYMVGVMAVAGLLVYEHSLVRPGDLSRLDAAFFSMNGVISIVFFCFVLLERVL